MLWGRIASFFTLSEKSRKWVPLILALFTLASLIRIVFFFYFLENDQDFFYDGDSSGYTGPALNMLLGNGFAVSEHPPYQLESFRTPGYPVFLFLHLALFGNFIPALFTQIFLTLLSAFIALKISDEYFRFEWGIIASALFLYAPFSIMASLQFTPGALFSTLLVASVWFLLRYLKTNQLAFLYTAAILLPLSAYVRPIALFILAPVSFALIMAWAWKQISLKRLLRVVAVLLFVFAAAVSPWFLRNYSVFGYFSFSSLPVYQLYFFEDVAFHAIANKKSFAESRTFFENHISEVTGKDYETYRRKYIEFSALTPQLSEEAFKFAGLYPAAVIEARLQQFGDFFIRDGIRYWFERLDARASSIKGFALSLYEVGAFSEHRGTIFFEQMCNLVIALGGFLALALGFRRKSVPLVFLGFLVLYFALLSGVASSASYRYQAEPLLSLLGVIGIAELFIFSKKHLSKSGLQSSS